MTTKTDGSTPSGGERGQWATTHRELEARSLALECRVKELEGALQDLIDGFRHSEASPAYLHEANRVELETGQYSFIQEAVKKGEKALSATAPEPSKLMAVLQALEIWSGADDRCNDDMTTSDATEMELYYYSLLKDAWRKYKAIEALEGGEG